MEEKTTIVRMVGSTRNLVTRDIAMQSDGRMTIKCQDLDGAQFWIDANMLEVLKV